MKINEQIKNIRLQHGYSQREFAERIGVRQSIIVRIEQGHPTTTSTIEKICKSFGCEMRLVFNSTDETIESLSLKFKSVRRKIEQVVKDIDQAERETR